MKVIGIYGNGIVKTFNGLYVETYCSVNDYIFAKSLKKSINHNFLLTAFELAEIEAAKEKMMKQFLKNLF